MDIKNNISPKKGANNIYLSKMQDNRTLYEKNIQDRSQLHYLIGLIVRWIQNIKYAYARKIARKRGATIGEGVIMPLKLAKRCNKHTSIGNHTSIGTHKIDTRCPISLGNCVIIGSNSEIITASHNIDSPEWEYKPYGIEIEDYVWIAQNAIILPSCRHIGRGAVIGTGALIHKDVESMSIMSGNPAKELRKRKCVHENLVVESCLGGDYKIYKKVRTKK